ncbi:hypothetical protein JTE90_028371 [Oedothorax gibbosus]|uniref:Uncharacterized protein n=1 Tax=Oedothorax gibbosus TaxID=931172 RepID=A0AAV6VDD3_9ARAC|nr:hypothetical protein JTE90_028371 [Oedothorax gibbosus]
MFSKKTVKINKNILCLISQALPFDGNSERGEVAGKLDTGKQVNYPAHRVLPESAPGIPESLRDSRLLANDGRQRFYANEQIEKKKTRNISAPKCLSTFQNAFPFEDRPIPPERVIPNVMSVIQHLEQVQENVDNAIHNHNLR